ncbi:MAG: glycosyltransferase family 2 protein [Bacteroidota bacterium]
MKNQGSKIPITVAIPIKNEEANIAKCLDRLEQFSEIVLLDSGSTDKTIEIAERHGVEVLQFNWTGNYPKKRNWYLLNHRPSQPWVLFLDADEFIDQTFCDEVRGAVDRDEVDGYWLSFTNFFLGKELKYGLQQRKLALFRFGKGLYEKVDEDGWSRLDMEVHEHPIIDGRIETINAPIDHRDYKGLAKFIERHKDYAMWEARRYLKLLDDPSIAEHFTARQQFKYRHLAKWWYPWFYFLFTYVAKRGVLDGGAGFHYAAYKAWYFQTIRLLIIEQQKLAS